MTSPAAEILGYVVIIAALYFLARLADRRRKPTVAELVADALIESALRDGEDDAAMAAACEREAALNETAEPFDARLLPLSDSEVAQRIRKVIDENTAVRQIRADVDAWGVA